MHPPIPRRRILFTSHTLDFRAGGAERVLYDVLSRMDRERFDVSLAAARDLDGLPEQFEQLGIEPSILPPLPMISGRSLSSMAAVGLALLRLHLSLLRLLRRERPDALYVNSIFALHFAALPAALERIPLIYHEHGLARGRQASMWSKAFPWLMGKVTHSICIADAVKEQLLEVGIAPERATTIHNGLEMAGAVPPTAKQREPAASGFTIAQIANFLPWKGHETVIRAVGQLKQRVPGLRVVFFGHSKNPELDADLQRLVAELGIEDAVEFAGFREDVLELLPSFDCLVLASQGEPFGLVLIEAMRAGVPVIATNAGGVVEIVTHDSDGLLFEVDDDDALAHQIDRLAHDDALANRLRARGFATAKDRFSIEAQVRAIEDLIETVVKTGRS